MDILTLTETACANLCLSASTANGFTVNVYTGLDNEDKQAPAVICTCVDATEDFPDSAIWHIKTAITVKEIASDTEVTSTLADSIFSVLSTATNEQISGSVSGLAVYDINLGEYSKTQDQNAWVKTMSGELVACLT